MADLIDRDALLKDMGLTDAVKYGNKDAEQQYRSYSTWMSYEIADSIWDAPAVNRWIPCSERLPEYGEYVLFIHKNLDVYVGYYDEKNTWNTDYQWFAGENVTHWMPLPEPPKRGTENGTT